MLVVQPALPQHNRYLILQQQPAVPSPHGARPLPNHWSPPLAPVEAPDHLPGLIPSVVPVGGHLWPLQSAERTSGDVQNGQV